MLVKGAISAPLVESNLRLGSLGSARAVLLAPIPPNLLMPEHVTELSASSAVLQVTPEDPGPVSISETAPVAATELLLLSMTALVHVDKVPLTPRIRTPAARMLLPHTSGALRRRFLCELSIEPDMCVAPSLLDRHSSPDRR